jgi:methyl-accepting chemotaxis protein
MYPLPKFLMSAAMKMRRFSIRARLILCMVLVVAIGLTIGGATTRDLLGMQSRFELFTQRDFAAALSMSKLSTAIGHVESSEKDVMIAAGDAAAVRAHRAEWAQAVDAATQHIKAVQTSLEGDERARQAEGLLQHLQAYSSAVTPVFDQIASGSLATAVAAAQASGAAHAELAATQAQLKQLTEASDQAAQTSRGEMQDSIWRTLIVLWALLWTPGVIFLPLMIFTILSVSLSLRHAEDVAGAIAKGDLSQRIEITGRDEITRLEAAMETMQASLREMVWTVRSSSEGMLTASTEIAAGNQDLSNRTEQTASNLQSAASSMQQINETVHHSADAAREASQLASMACQRAEHGGTVVNEVVSNMDQISEASRKISDIIGVIDNIAFQTNILALNAAVEAARAGEQGRGFAVVASEVRNLAQRSAQAAREIKTLIGTSVERVEAGSQRVRDAGSVMQEIVDAIHQVTTAMAGVADATVQQSQGLGQVSESVSQLDQMTQQNAALVEQSAAAADSLKSQANALAQAVARFSMAAHAA